MVNFILGTLLLLLKGSFPRPESVSLATHNCIWHIVGEGSC